MVTARALRFALSIRFGGDGLCTAHVSFALRIGAAHRDAAIRKDDEAAAVRFAAGIAAILDHELRNGLDAVRDACLGRRPLGVLT